MNDVPVRDPDDHSSRVYPFDGDLTNAVYKLGTADGVITGSIRYVLAVRDFWFDPAPPGSGGEEPPPPPLVPVMLITPENIRFQDTYVNDSSPPEALVIANTGTATLIIENMFFTELGWQISDANNTPDLQSLVGRSSPNLPIEIEPGFAKDFLLNFSPVEPPGEKTGSLIVVANVTTSPRTVGLSGLALSTIPPEPPPPDWLWLAGFVSRKSNGFQSLPISLPAMQQGDLALITIVWRGGERWNIPSGWDVLFEANNSLVTPGSRVSNLILTRVIQAGDPLGFNMTPRLGNSAIPFAEAFCVGWRPKNGTPRFVTLSNQDTGDGELTFEAPSLNIQNPRSLIFCVATLGTFEDRFTYPLQPFSAVGLSALPSIPMFSGGVGNPNEWRWSHLAHAATGGATTTQSMELYGLDRVPAGPTGKFVGTAVLRGQHRLVAIAFDGPT